MSAGIVRGIDRGIVGNCEIFGGTWHGFEEYKQLPALVPFADAETCLNYEVVAVPLVLKVTDPTLAAKLPNANGMDADQFALVRVDTGNIVFGQSVSDEYTVFQNLQFLKRIEESLLKNNPGMGIESCGTLFAGRCAFVNILIDRFRVKKDDSETATRLMYYNAFGGRSITAGAHDTRIVCDNTRRLAEAQSEANDTLRKFRHSSGAPGRVGKYLVDLTNLLAAIRENRPVLDRLAEVQMTVRDVGAFLGNLFPIATGAGKATVTTRENKRAAVQEVFETAPDLQGAIARTRYAMFQAVTNYSQHSMTTRGSDAAYAWWDTVTNEKGGRNRLNVDALNLLTQTDIPDAPVAVLDGGAGDADPTMN